jgi:hypothetical protein
MFVNLLSINHGHNTDTKLQMLSQIPVGEGGEERTQTDLCGFTPRLLPAYSQSGEYYIAHHTYVMYSSTRFSYFPALGLKGLSH